MYASDILNPVVIKNQPIEINAEELLAPSQASGDLRAQIKHEMNDESFAKELSKLGIDKKEVEQRLAGMTDQELKQIQNGVQRQAGGDVVVISVTTLLVILIVLVLLLRG